MGQTTRQNISFAASGVGAAFEPRLSSEGRGPFDVAGQRFRVETDEGHVVSDARVWLGDVDVTEAVVRDAQFEVSMNAVDVTSMGESERTYIPGESRAVVTVELMLPGQFKVKGTTEEDWEGPVILDQKELL